MSSDYPLSDTQRTMDFKLCLLISIEHGMKSQSCTLQSQVGKEERLGVWLPCWLPGIVAKGLTTSFCVG